MNELLEKLFSVSIITFLFMGFVGLLFYTIFLYHKYNIFKKKIRSTPGQKEITERRIKQFRREKIIDRFLGFRPKDVLSIFINFILVFVAISSLFYSTQENQKLNRPYIQIDASDISDQLKVFHGDPSISIIENESMPYNNSFSFYVKNIGKLPAKYEVNVSEFKREGLEEILPPENNTGFIFPNQSIELRYDLRGSLRKSDRTESDRLIALSKGDYSQAGAILIRYGYLDNTEFNFQTRIEERIIEHNCNTAPTPSRCFANPTWTVVNAK